MLGAFVVLILTLLMVRYVLTAYNTPENGLSSYSTYINYVLIVLVIISPFIICYSSKFDEAVEYSNNYEKYEKYKTETQWKDANEIIQASKVNKFADDYPQQKKVMEKCYDFTNKYYSNNDDMTKRYPTKKNLKDNKEYYVPAMQCIDTAKLYQEKATRQLNSAHDGCINALQQKDKGAHAEHMKNIFTMEYRDKETQYNNCNELMGQTQL